MAAAAAVYTRCAASYSGGRPASPNIALPAAAATVAAAVLVGGDDPAHDDLLEIGVRWRARRVPRPMAARPRRRSREHPREPSTSLWARRIFASAAERGRDAREYRRGGACESLQVRAAAPEIMARGFSAVLFCLLPVIVVVPLWSRHSVPSKPPCPVHGYNSNMTQHGKALWASH